VPTGTESRCAVSAWARLGILAVFLSVPDSTSLLAVAILLLGVAAFSDRIRSLSFGGAKLELRDLARQRATLATERARRGDVEGASIARRQAQGFQRLAGAYERLRRTNRPGPERSRILDQIVDQARQLACDVEFDPVDVWAWFDEGADEARAIALGLMLGDERCRTSTARWTRSSIPAAPSSSTTASPSLVRWPRVCGLQSENGWRRR
jgi:hypothetical protein